MSKGKKKIYIAAWKKRKHNGDVYICLFKMPGDERIFVWWNDVFLSVKTDFEKIWRRYQNPEKEWKMLCVRVGLREKSNTS